AAGATRRRASMTNNGMGGGYSPTIGRKAMNASHHVNATYKWRRRTEELETIVCRLWYYIEFGAYNPETLEQLRLDVKGVMGVRKLWKKKVPPTGKVEKRHAKDPG